MVQNNRRVIRISKRKVGLIFVALMIALGIWYGMSASLRNSSFRGGPDITYPGSMGAAESGDVNIGSTVTSKMMPDFYRNNQQQSVNDTREFLKTSYSASIRTRDVKDVVTSAKNIVKGNDGRVDNISSSEKNGYLTFVVPKSKFESFRDEIESLTHKKLFSESISSQNLLSEKQSIENRISSINSALANLKQQKATLLSKHTQSVATINSELSSIKSQLNDLKKLIKDTDDQDTLNSLRAQESALSAREGVQKQKLAAENSSYLTQNDNLDNQIKSQNDSLVNVNNQDVKFEDNIETVNGSISVSWISIWEMARAFSPIAPEILLIVFVLIAWNILARLNYVPKFVLE